MGDAVALHDEAEAISAAKRALLARHAEELLAVLSARERELLDQAAALVRQLDALGSEIGELAGSARRVRSAARLPQLPHTPRPDGPTVARAAASGRTFLTDGGPPRTYELA